jgi:teichuronic acid biosynthesis glycosyltransferase TuaC
MKLLFVIPGKGGGAEAGSSMIFARRQAESLAQEGVAVEVFHLRSRTSPRILLAEFWRLRRVLKSFRPHVVHAHFGTMTAMLTALAAGRCPLVITYRGSDLNPVPSARGLRAAMGRLLSQLAALRAARIVCVSGRLKQRLWWRRGRVTVLVSGVDFEVFRPEPRGLARARLGWPEEERVVLFHAGQDSPNKRLDLAEAALREVKLAGSPVRLEVLNGRGPSERIPVLMNAADCLLVTSDAEGSPTVVQEALASNLPVISVDVGDVPERLQGVACSRIVARDPAALARAVAELVEAPRRSDGRRKAGEFCSHRIARELARLYRGILREQSD